MPDIAHGSTSDSSEGRSSSSDDGPTSTDTPGCAHEWMAIRMSYGAILGVDSTGAPVFIEDCDDSRAGTGYGCAKCDKPWTPALAPSSPC